MNEQFPEKFRQDEEIIRLTIDQIKKDFGTRLPDLQLSGRKETLYDELVMQLGVALRAIQKSNPGMLKPLLYRVDVSEKELPDSSKPDFYPLLAEAIIRREFSKVLTRRFFGPNP